MLGVIEGFGIIAVIILVGYFFARSRVAPENTGVALNKYVFYIGYPFLMFTLLSKRDISSVLSEHILIVAISAAIISVLFLIVNHFTLKLKGNDAAIAQMSSVYLNSNNIGLPLATYVLHDPIIVAPVLLFQVVILGPMFIIMLERNKGGPRKSLISRLTIPLKNPLIIGVIAGLIASELPFEIPDFVFKPLDMIAQSAVPVVLIAYGMSLYGAKFLERGTGVRITLVAVFMKMAVMPITTYLFVKYGFHIDGPLLYSYTALAALPTAQNVFNFATIYETNKVVARDSVLLSTLLAPFVIVLIAGLLG